MVDAVEMWLEEKKNYNGEAISMTNLNQVGHYTAVRGTNGMVFGVC